MLDNRTVIVSSVPPSSHLISAINSIASIMMLNITSYSVMCKIPESDPAGLKGDTLQQVELTIMNGIMRY